MGRHDLTSTISALSAVTAPYGAPPIATALATARIEHDDATPSVKVRGLPRSVDARQLGRGVELTIESRNEIAVDATLVARGPFARWSRRRVVAADVSGFASGRRTLELRADHPPSCANRCPRAELRLATTDRRGNRRLLTRPVTLRR